MLNHEAQTNCSHQPELTISQEAAQLAILRRRVSWTRLVPHRATSC
jgi:hypothetical protein